MGRRSNKAKAADAAAAQQQQRAAEAVRQSQQVGRQVVNPAGTREPGPLAAPLTEGIFEYDDNGRLTRQGMLDVLRSGRTVLHSTPTGTGGVRTSHIREAGQVPSEVELAGGDDQSIDRAEESLEARQRAIDSDRERLGTLRKRAQDRRKGAEKADKNQGPPAVRVRDDDGRPLVSGAQPTGVPYRGVDPDADAEADKAAEQARKDAEKAHKAAEKQ